MTPALRAYLADWLRWAENGAQDGWPYWRHHGLCPKAPVAIREELKNTLIAEFGEWMHPFGRDDYLKRRVDDTQHLCPKRLAWVRAKLEQEPA